MTKKEWNDKTLNIADVLKKEASEKYMIDVRVSEAYRDGYIQALSDLSKRISCIQEEPGICSIPEFGCSGL